MINPNAAFEDELFHQYLRDPQSVSPEWRHYFEENYEKFQLPHKERKPPREQKKNKPEQAHLPIAPKPYQEFTPPEEEAEQFRNEGDEIIELSSVQSKIAKNMEESIEVPTATSSRSIPVKALDENRRIINKYLLKMKRPKVSFTHILAWAIVRALMKFPYLNDAFAVKNNKPGRIKRKHINIGLAVDITKKDGTRLLLVPNVKNAGQHNFSEFIEEFQKIIDKTRSNKIALSDLEDTTVTLTNPGMIGTTASSPRLMKGQGMIIATGSIDYPTEFQAVRPEIMTTFALSKVVTMTNTYDHRIIQGAESAEFLAYIHKLLIGGDQFYDQIFASLKIPFEPVRWAIDNTRKGNNGFIDIRDTVEKGAHAVQMINAYRVRGHLLASVNPLGQESYYYPELDPAYYGFTIWDLDREFHADDTWERNELPLRDIIELLRETYCGTLSIEFMHIQNPDRKEWLKKRLEGTRSSFNYSETEKKHIYKKLIDAESFENFLHTKFLGHKRFSLEGGESLIVLIDKLFEKSADSDLHSIVLGMAHRGRLNALVNNIGKSHRAIFKEFDGDIDPVNYYGAGDVKYHLGDQGQYISPKENSIPVILAPNPSHLELVNPVVEGMARAIDNEIKDKLHSDAIPILVHGDAAFAGQGIVAETLNLSQLSGYKTGGTIHIIVNNQIGFTTTSDYARSTVYATDIAKMIQTPILHVNGNDPEAVRTAAVFAFEYRQKFKSDVIIDMLCWRKYGHNEADEPSYTQPLLYKKLNKQSPVAELYGNLLVKDNIITEDERKKVKKEAEDFLNKKYASRKESEKSRDIPNRRKEGQTYKKIDTRVSEKDIKFITEKITHVPAHFNINPKVKALLKRRHDMVMSDKPAIDWAMAEHLAFGSILMDGHDIRFSGQDSRRGTFSQRHAVLFDVKTEEEYTPLNDISENQSKIRIYDSPLSEMAVLGFEYGYSVLAKNCLTFWEAQFGDFFNNAQSIADQFIACGEVKWGVTTNLVLLLPHSYDGQGPEHSSARPERFLQLCADENMIVANLTSPAQYFHILRRQMKLENRVPLVIMTPKSMLRHTNAVSDIRELESGEFKHMRDDDLADKENVKRINLCSGKIFHELWAHREKIDNKDTAIISVEQLYPLYTEYLSKLISSYPNAKELVWVQEEPKNMGSWHYIHHYLIDLAQKYSLKLHYVGRKESAATATGLMKIHLAEQNKIMEDSFAGF
ncbi:MAG: multifunctional oxoglutarate decarboxylase/oxoglutarate dehydrogenase thiamine pyrophosphate-binding subunit/dihydrolipoyllysine-residue succinyltransferase subunit [Candidatus Kapaibacterium sp.]